MDIQNLIIIVVLFTNLFLGMSNVFVDGINDEINNTLTTNSNATLTIDPNEYENATTEIINSPTLEGTRSVLNSVKTILNGIPETVRSIMSVVNAPEQLTNMIYYTLTGLMILIYAMFLLQVVSSILS